MTSTEAFNTISVVRRTQTLRARADGVSSPVLAEGARTLTHSGNEVAASRIVAGLCEEPTALCSWSSDGDKESGGTRRRRIHTATTVRGLLSGYVTATAESMIALRR